MIYLLLANASLAIGFGLYLLCLRKLTFFQWNRVYLLGMVAISMLVPIGLFIDISSFFVKDEIISSMDLSDVTRVIINPIMTEQSSYSLMDVMVSIYWIGLVIGIGLLIYRLLSLRRTFFKQESFASFSFFNKVFIGAKVKESVVIDKHEQIHVDQGHSYDILFLELVCVFNWFNPIAYFIRKELKLQHECIADELCSEDRIAYAELLVANALRTEVNSLVHEFSNQSFLKKRIMVLFKNKTRKIWYGTYLIAIPFFYLIFVATCMAKSLGVNDMAILLEGQFHERELIKGGLDNLLVFDKVNSKVAAVYKETSPSPKNGINLLYKSIYAGLEKEMQKRGEENLTIVMDIMLVVNSDGAVGVFKAQTKVDRAYIEVVKNIAKRTEWNPGTKEGIPISGEFSMKIGTGKFGK